MSSTDLTIPVGDWDVWDNRNDLIPAEGLNTIENVPRGGAKRFFALVEQQSHGGLAGRRPTTPPSRRLAKR